MGIGHGEYARVRARVMCLTLLFGWIRSSGALLGVNGSIGLGGV